MDSSGATAILIPEQPYDIDHVCELVKHRYQQGTAPIVVVAEGALPKEGTLSTKEGELDAFGHVRLVGVGDQVASAIEERTGHESRSVVLGHLQRGVPQRLDAQAPARLGALGASLVVARGGVRMVLAGVERHQLPVAELERHRCHLERPKVDPQSAVLLAA